MEVNYGKPNITYPWHNLMHKNGMWIKSGTKKIIIFPNQVTDLELGN